MQAVPKRSAGIVAAVSQAVERYRDNAEIFAREQVTRFAKNLASPYKIGIITALPKETAAVEMVFGAGTRLPTAHRGAISFSGISCPATDGGGEHNIVLCQSLRMGNNSAAVAAASLLSEFSQIEDILLVGIAGGIPNLDAARAKTKCDDHVRKGDLVISDQVLQYDMIKLEEDKQENRSKSPQPSARLIAAVNKLDQETSVGQHKWEKYLVGNSLPKNWKRPRRDHLYNFEFDEHQGFRITETKIQHPRQDRRRGGYPYVHRGTIGSANILLKNSRVRDALKKAHKIRAIEMEGSGIADAAWTFNVGYLIVRGICDYCDRKKDDAWQNHAALVAAAYARAIVERVPTE